MKVFHREFGSRYETYEFGYTTYALLEPGDDLAFVYGSGFLPHSADSSASDLFYMARSVRVPLHDWKVTSENRRIQKKFETGFHAIILTAAELQEDPHFMPCFLTYFRERHGERVMSEERAHRILATTLPLRAVRYEQEGTIAGYVLEVVHGHFSHYWFSCYAPSYTGTSFGMWLMLDAARRAKEEGRERIYLGTAYGAKGRYKTNFEPLEFWNGSEWLDDIRALKALISAP